MINIADSLGLATVGFKNSQSDTNSLSVATIGYHADSDTEISQDRHYPRLRQLGQYDQLYPPTKDGVGNMHTNLKIIAKHLDTADDMAILLRNEMHPIATTKWIDLWAKVTDSKFTTNATIADQRQDIIAKLRARGGLSKAYFITLCQALGYTYGPSTAKPIWFIEGSGVGLRYFRAGYSKAGDPVFERNSDGVERSVTVIGDKVTTDIRLKQLFEKLICKGITVIFKDI